MSILWLAADARCSGNWFTVFTILMLKCTYNNIFALSLLWVWTQFFKHWGQNATNDAVLTFGLNLSHGNISLALFMLMKRRLPNWCIVVLLWLKYLILAIGLCSYSSQYPVKRVVESSLDSSTLLHIHHAAFLGFCWYWLVYKYSECLGILVFTQLHRIKFQILLFMLLSEYHNSN